MSLRDMDIPKIYAARVDAQIAKCNSVKKIAFEAGCRGQFEGCPATLSQERTFPFVEIWDVNRSMCTHLLELFLWAGTLNGY